MKILMVDPFQEINGPHQVVFRLSQSLIQNGYLVYAVIPDSDIIYERYLSIGAKIFVMSGLEPLRRGFNLLYVFKWLLRNLIITWKILRIAKTEGIEILHSATPTCWAGGFAAKLLHKKSVFHIQDLTLGSSLFAAIYSFLILKFASDLIICVSQIALRKLPFKHFLFGKAIVVYNAVDTEKFLFKQDMRNLSRHKLNLEPYHISIGIFGNFDYRKGQDKVVSCAKSVTSRNPFVQFFFVGGESPLSEMQGYLYNLKRHVETNGLSNHVTFLGKQDNIENIMSAMDIVIQPSRVDAGPLVPIEAMAMGVPVIATNVGANPEEVVNNITGIIVPVDDEEEMVNSLIRLIDTPALRETMSKAGRKWVEDNFSLTQQTSVILEAYRKLLN